MSIQNSFYFAARLAWRQLIHERSKVITAMLGVMFAAVLVFMQLGFKDSLYDSIKKVPNKMSGDIFLMHKQSEALWRTTPFNRYTLQRALGNPDVTEVYPLYVGLGSFKNPVTRTLRTLMVLGVDPQAGVFAKNDIAPFVSQLDLQDKIIFDNLSRPEFGPIKDLLAQGEVITELQDRKVEVVGVFNMGASFAADGNVVTSDTNFARIFRNRTLDGVDVGVIRVREGANPEQVKAQLQGMLDEDVNVFTHADLVNYEMAYWSNNAPIGFIFGFGTIMGLVVGMVIVYQILFTDITNHLNEYATLKAMGYAHAYFLMVVFASSMYLALLGFLPGLTLSYILYTISEQVTFIPMPMPFSKIMTVFTLILTMCFFAGALAVRRLRAANPADMF